MGRSVDYKRTTGIYAIEVKEKNMVYVGQSVDVPTRIRQHKSVLKAGRCKNREMQTDWDKGYQFEFKLIEECYNKDLLFKETKHTRQYVRDGWGVYNVCIVSETVIANIPTQHKDFVLELLKAIDSGVVQKERIRSLYVHRIDN